MKPVIIILIAFVLLIPTTVYGANGYFEENTGNHISHQPTVCIFQPNDSKVTDQRWDNWYYDSKLAIDSWRATLESSGDENWKIDIVEVPLEKLERLNYSACDVTIEFVEKPYMKDGEYVSVLGWAERGTGKIAVVYSSFDYCGKIYDEDYNIFVNSYCFTDDFERSKKMANTVKHEFGHIVGLGHYRGYDNDVSQSWYDSGVGSPSIMAWIEPNEEWRSITQTDVQKVREIYGSSGFGKKIDSMIPVFNDPIIPEYPITVKGQTNIHITDTSVSNTISGNVPDKLFKRGTHLQIVIEDPNGFIETKATTVSKTRQAYNYQLSFDQSSTSGLYEIYLKFDGTVFEKIPINVSVDSSYNKSDYPSESKAIVQDSDGDGVNDVDDACPNTPYGAIVKSDGCLIDSLTLKNEKTVINKKFYISGHPIDYSITSGKLLDIIRDMDVNSLIISISATSDGSLTLTIPRSVLDTKIDGTNDDDDFFVLVDGEAVYFDEMASSMDRTITIPFYIGSEEIEIIGTESKPYRLDSDGDGFIDSKDDCPTDAGIGRLNGCPETDFKELEETDSDGDGFPDIKDNCPNLYYTSFGGCPKSIAPNDMDNDRVFDEVDRCPRVFALTNDGCPETTDNFWQAHELQYEKRIEKEEREKEEQKTRMTVLEIELNSIKEKVTETQKILDDTYNDIKNAESKYTSAESKKIIERSWDTYNKALDDFSKSEGWANEYDQKIRDANTGSFEEQKRYYDSLIPEMKHFNDNRFEPLDEKLVGITEELNGLEKINNLEKLEKQTCFLFWCW